MSTVSVCKQNEITFLHTWETISVQERIKSAEEQLSKGLIPVIVDRTNGGEPDIKKHKFAVVPSKQFSDLMQHVRKQINLNSSEALFFFTPNGHIPPPYMTLGELYKEYASQSKDKFLKIQYCKENTFGLCDTSKLCGCGFKHNVKFDCLNLIENHNSCIPETCILETNVDYSYSFSLSLTNLFNLQSSGSCNVSHIDRS